MSPDTFDGSTDFEERITHLNLCSQINGWSEGQKVKFLAVRLRGAALQVYTDFVDEMKCDFKAVVSALLERFSS